MTRLLMNLRATGLATGAVVVLASGAAAQLPNASAASLGMGENATASARGYNAAAWNAAGLGMPNNPKVSFALMSIRGLTGLDPISLSDLKEHEGENLSAAVRQEWLDEIIAEGSEQGSAGTDITYLAASVGRVGIQLSTSGHVLANVGPGTAELFLFGNAGRTGEPVDVTLEGSSFDAVVTSTVALAYGQPLMRSANSSLSVGATLKYTFGHLMFTGQDDGGAVRANPLQVELDFPMLVSDTVLVFDKLDNGSGIGLDLGLAYQTGAWTVGLAAKNVVNNFEWDEESLFYRPGTAIFDGDENEADFDPQPFSAAPQGLRERVENLVGGAEFAGGLAFQPSRRILLNADFRTRSEESRAGAPKSHIGAGAELRPLSWLPIRVGGAILDGGTLVSGGLGLEFGAINLTASVAQRDTDFGMDQMAMFTFSSMRRP